MLCGLRLYTKGAQEPSGFPEGPLTVCGELGASSSSEERVLPSQLQGTSTPRP